MMPRWTAFYHVLQVYMDGPETEHDKLDHRLCLCIVLLHIHIYTTSNIQRYKVLGHLNFKSFLLLTEEVVEALEFLPIAVAYSGQSAVFQIQGFSETQPACSSLTDFQMSKKLAEKHPWQSCCWPAYIFSHPPHVGVDHLARERHAKGSDEV